MSKHSSAKYYQNNKKRLQKKLNMVKSETQIYLNMKTKAC